MAAVWLLLHSAHGNGAEYSSLHQIDTRTVADVDVAWTFDSGDAYPGSEMPCQPLFVDGVLYATTPGLAVVALDAGTGELRWRRSPAGERRPLGKLRSRGVAYWTDGRLRRVYVGVRQYLYALDANTGEIVRSFGEHGRIDLRVGLGSDPKAVSISLTSPPAVFEDLLIVGSVVSETLPSTPGDIRAYDARSGQLRWTFRTIPAAGEPGADTWPPGARERFGGANAWAGVRVDTRTGIVYVPTGSAAFDFYGANRVGDNLFANTLLALDARTGERRWHFQAVRHDVWDRDLPAPPTLVTLRRDGREIDAIAQPTKSGHVWILERATGKPVFPFEERAVPPSDVPGEVVAPTQPLPLLPVPFARQRLTAAELTLRTPASHAAVAAEFARLRSDGQFVPGSTQGTIVFPGIDGGAEWGGAAFDPVTRHLFVNANEMAWVLRLVPRSPAGATAPADGRQVYLAECAGCHGADLRGTPPAIPTLVTLRERYTDFELLTLLHGGAGRMPAFARLGWERLIAVKDYVLHARITKTPLAPVADADAQAYVFDGYRKFLDPDGYPAVKPPWGTLSAIDLDTGTLAWQVPLGEYPELAAQGLPTTGSENYGGPLVTAGGLLFIGATSYDRKFRAFDTATGHQLREWLLPAAGHATPITYEWQGRQYVVIAAGGGRSAAPSAGTYVAFALPRREAAQ